MAAGRSDPTALDDPHVINLVALLIAQPCPLSLVCIGLTSARVKSRSRTRSTECLLKPHKRTNSGRRGASALGAV